MTLYNVCLTAIHFEGKYYHLIFKDLSFKDKNKDKYYAFNLTDDKLHDTQLTVGNIYEITLFSEEKLLNIKNMGKNIKKKVE